MTDADNRPAVVGQVERPVRPRAWAARVPGLGGPGDGGDYLRSSPSLPSDGAPPLVWEPLYDQAALDAAVAAERERCAKVCEAVHADTAECPELALYCAERIRAA